MTDSPYRVRYQNGWWCISHVDNPAFIRTFRSKHQAEEWLDAHAEAEEEVET